MPEGIVGTEAPSAPINRQEKTVSYPQKYRDGAELVKPIIEHAGILTHDSKIKLKDGQEDKAIQASRRTFALRRVRAELMGVVKKIPKTDTEGRRDLISQGHARDELAEQFMSGQEEVSVEVGDTGKQTARFVVLTPPETRRSETQDAKPPIFMIPGISNDLEGMGMLPQELAFSGRKVILIGFPESWHGEATDAFGKATEESRTYEPHTTFFKEAIRAVEEKQEVRDRIGITSEIDLWGYSTGAAIVAEILATDKQFREQVANAAIICPPNCVDQKNFKIFGQEIPLPKAFINEVWETVRPRNIKDAAKKNVTNRHDIQYTEDHRKRMLRTYNALREKVLRRNDWWKNDLRVKEGGEITVVSYDKDKLTKSYKVTGEIEKTLNFHVVKLSGSHNTPLSKPKEAIEAVSA